MSYDRSHSGGGDGEMPLNPQEIVFFDLLHDSEADGSHCIRHDQDTESFDPLVHHSGELYTTADDWSVYSCPECRASGAESREHFRHHLRLFFEAWADPDLAAFSGAFKQIGTVNGNELPDGVFCVERRADK